MELRDYQRECIQEIEQMIDGEKKIGYLSTGSGKTIIFCKFIAEARGRALIVIDQEELLQQTIDKMKNFTSEIVGRVKGSLDETDNRIIVATRQSLTHHKSDRMERILSHGKIDYLIIDECHLALEQQKKIIKAINPKFTIGFSATPWATGIEKVYDDILYKKDILSLVKGGYLTSPRCMVVKTNTDLSGVKSVCGDFNQRELNDAIDTNERNKFIVHKWIEHASDRKSTLVFCSSINNSENIRDEFIKAGISCESIDSELGATERKAILDRFERGEIKVLCNVNILTKGVDITRIDCIVCATPTRSKMKYVQQVGRALRLHEGKKDALILDITDNYKKHSLINCKSVFGLEDGENIEEMEERIEREAEEERIGREKQEREAKLRKIKEKELIMKEIDLFNSNIFNVRENSVYDWYFNIVNQCDVAMLTASKDIDFYIVNNGDVYTSYKRVQLEGYTYDLEIISESNSLKEAQDEVENLANVIEKSGAYINPSCSWKSSTNITEKQKIACKGKEVKTVWDVSKFFSKRNCYFALKDIL